MGRNFRLRGIHSPKIFAGNNSHIFVILFKQDIDKLLGNIRSYFDWNTGRKGPVIRKYLIPDQKDAISFFGRICFINIEFITKIQKEYLRITFYVFIRIRHNRISC